MPAPFHNEWAIREFLFFPNKSTILLVGIYICSQNAKIIFDCILVSKRAVSIFMSSKFSGISYWVKKEHWFQYSEIKIRASTYNNRNFQNVKIKKNRDSIYEVLLSHYVYICKRMIPSLNSCSIYFEHNDVDRFHYAEYRFFDLFYGY